MKRFNYIIAIIFIAIVTCSAQSKRISVLPKVDFYLQGINQFNEDKYADAVNSFDLYIKKNPKDADGYYYRGTAKAYRDFGSGKDNAIADLQFVLKNSSDIELKKKSLIMIGKALEWNKDYTGAIENYEASLTLTKGNYNFRVLDYDSFVGIADCYFQIHDYEKCVEASSKAIGINQNKIRAYEIRSSASYNLGLKSAAKLDYEKILSIEPNNWYYLSSLGTYYYIYSKEPNSTSMACYYFANARNAFLAKKSNKGNFDTFTYENIEVFKSVCGNYIPSYFK